MNNTRAVAWVGAAFIAVTLPFVVLLSGERVEGRTLLWDFAMGLGFGALALVALQFVLTARFRPMTHPFGVDIVYVFHRFLALGAVAVMLGHFGILYFWFEEALGELNPFEARWELTAGRVALVSFGLLVVTSELRKWLKLEYGLWRYLHFGLAIVGFAAAVAHVLGVGRLTAAIEIRALWLGVTFAWVLLLAWVHIGKPWLQRRNPWRVVRNVAHRGGAHSLVLRPTGRPLKPWKPGQFAWLTFAASPYQLGEHPFTISSAPEEGPDVTLSIKPLGDFSSRAAQAREGDIAYLEGPFGVFTIDAMTAATGFAMVAGGIGITPMLANLRAMRARGDGRPVVLFYANPDIESMAFEEELDALQASLDLKLVHVLEKPPQEWSGETGFVTRDVLERHLPEDRNGLHVLLCGPAAMTESVRQSLATLGIPEDRVRSEVFDMV